MKIFHGPQIIYGSDLQAFVHRHGADVERCNMVYCSAGAHPIHSSVNGAEAGPALA